MSLEMFQSCVQGYSDRIFDQQIQAVQTGYWVAYYSNSKHPKPLKTLITEMVNRRLQANKKATKSVTKPEVDVDAFIATEEQFLRRLQSK